MPASPIGIGQLGYGSIGKIHALGYRSIPSYYPRALPPITMAGVCTGSMESARRAAEDGGYGRYYDAVQALVGSPEVTVVDCALPNRAHKEALRLALAAGKHVYCEKPLCLSAAEAKEIVGFARTARARIGMTFNYRFVPAVQRARELIEAGAIGEVYSFAARYLHTGYQDPSRPLSWRMDRSQSGGGALADLGSHVIDLIRFLLGDIASVFATTRTFITERPLSKGSTERGPVTVDDAAWLQARLSSGARGTIEVSRFATGSSDDLAFRIEGSAGAVKFDLMDANWLYFYDAGSSPGASAAGRGWIRLETASAFPGAVIAPARSILGWARTHAENQYRFLKSVVEGAEPSPGLVDGVAAQLVLDASYRSAEIEQWVPVERFP